MSEKDLCTKALEVYNDVFADIINVLLLKKEKIEQEKLRDLPAEKIYKDQTGTYRSMYRDTLKEYRIRKENNYFALASFGLENQTKVERMMPVRVQGYDYTSYKKQMEIYKKERQDLNKALKTTRENGEQEREKEILEKLEDMGEFYLHPMITLVLNFSEQRWNQPTALKELVEDDNPFKKYMTDYSIRVYDIAYLEDEVIEKFTSDFRIIAKFFKSRRMNAGKYEPDDMEIKHLEALTDFLQVFTDDGEYDKILPQLLERQRKGEVITMCKVREAWVAEGIEQGIEKGIEKGIEQGIEQGMRKGIEKGLQVLVSTLKNLLSTPEEIMEQVIRNEEYKDIKLEDIKRYY